MSLAAGGRSSLLLLGLAYVALIVAAVISYGAITTVSRSGGAFITQQNEKDRTVTVTGQASLTASPDQASIILGAESRAATAQQAASSNAQVMERFLRAIRELGVEEKDIKTASYSIQPVLRYDKEGMPQIVEYRVTNMLQVSTSELRKVGEIIDKAVSLGANRVDSVQFSLTKAKQKDLRSQAIQTAIEDAKERARSATEPLNVRVVGVKEISVTDSGTPIFKTLRQLPPTAEAGTPIPPGEITFTVSVQVIFLIQ